MIIGNIKQTGMILQTEDNVLSPQWSENLQLQVTYDDTFTGWSVKWDAINDLNKKRIPLAYDTETRCITLNKECFQGNYLYLACIFVKGKECHNTDPIEFHIPNSLKHGLNNDPDIPNLYDEMRELFQQIFDNEYREPLNDLFERGNKAIDDVNQTDREVQENEQHRVSNEQQRMVDENRRNNEEDARMRRESERMQNETDRQSREDTREVHEEERQRYEQARQMAEDSRQSAETNRIGEEKQRKSAEEDRQSAENDRQRREQYSQNMESTREQQEIARQNAEEERIENEQNRIHQFEDFQALEEQCQNNEAMRESREEQRISNENERLENETRRQLDTSSAINRAHTAAKLCEGFTGALDKKVNIADVESTLNATSENPIQSKAVYNALKAINGNGNNMPLLKRIWSGYIRTDSKSLSVNIDTEWYYNTNGTNLSVLTLGINIHRAPSNTFYESPKLIFINLYKDNGGYSNILYSQGNLIGSFVNETLYGADADQNPYKMDVSLLCYIHRNGGEHTLTIQRYGSNYCYITDVFVVLPDCGDA